MTKREIFAYEILSSMISFPHDDNVPSETNIKSNIKLSVKAADWLIEELEKSNSLRPDEGHKNEF